MSNTALLLVLVSCLGQSPSPAGPAAANGAVADQAAASVRHAETYYWLGMQDDGSPLDLRAGQCHLAQARQLLKQGLPAGQADQLSDRISALESDLDSQAAVAGVSLEGVFPLTRFLASSSLAPRTAGNAYRWRGDPAVTAALDAADDLAARVADWEKDRHLLQLPVVLAAIPQNQAVENALLRVFLASPRFRVRTHAEVATALTHAELADFRASRVTPAVKRQLLAGLAATKLLVVFIRQVDQTDDVTCCRAEGQILEASGDAPSDSFSTLGFGRDRRSRMAWLVEANLALLVLAFAVYLAIAYTHRAMAAGISRLSLLVMPLVGFAAGRALPYAIAPLLGSICPAPGSPAWVSCWFPLLAGLALIGGTVAIYWLASPQLVKASPIFSPDTRGGALMAAMGAGIAAYLATPLLLYLDTQIAAQLGLLVVSVILLAYLTGRAVDSTDRMPIATAVAPLALTMPLGAALLHADTIWLAAAAALIVAAAAAIIAADFIYERRRRLAAERHGQPHPAPLHGGIPADLDALIGRAEDPDYQPFSAFAGARQRVGGLLEGRCVHLGLFGARGAGKTATADAVVDYLVQQLAQKRCYPAILRGDCCQAVGQPISYGPFRQALAHHFDVNLLTPPGPKILHIGQTLGGLVGSALPFASILFPRSAANGEFVARPDEINASIAWLLRRLSKASPVLLFLDDVQWLDEASATLVKHLLHEFPADSGIPLLVLLTTNDKSSLADLGFDVAGHGLEVTYPSRSEQAQILAAGSACSHRWPTRFSTAWDWRGKATAGCSGRSRWRQV